MLLLRQEQYTWRSAPTVRYDLPRYFYKAFAPMEHYEVNFRIG